MNAHSKQHLQPFRRFWYFSVSVAEDNLHHQCLAAGRDSGEANATALRVKYSRQSPLPPHAKTAKGQRWHRLVSKLAQAAE